MKKSSTSLKVAIALAFALCNASIFAQTFTAFNTYNSRQSDYYLGMSFSGVNCGSFDCGCDNDISVYAGDGYNQDQYMHNRQLSMPASGSSMWGYQPNSTQTWYVTVIKKGHDYTGICVECSSVACSGGSVAYHQDNIGTRSATTHALYAPVGGYNTTTTIPGGITVPVIRWSKNSDVPDNYMQYRIYRAGILVGTVSGFDRSFIDSNALINGSVTYTVSSYSTTWGTMETQSAPFTVTITNQLLRASDRTYYGKTNLQWPNFARFAPHDIQITRNGEELAIVNKNATAYNDFDGVPGVVYTYGVAPIDANDNKPFTITDPGSSRPNGVIKGNVRTPFSAAVSGVTMVAYTTVDGNFFMDSVVTDASGFYQFNDLYYNDSAVFTIVPHKGSHHFNPDTLRRTLGLNNNVASGVDFTDTSVFTLKGKILFTANSYCGVNGCASAGVNIYNNGLNTSITTNANGQFSLAIQQEGYYTIKPVLPGHRFSPDSVVLHVLNDNFNVNFTDFTTDTLYLSLKGGCKNAVAHHAIVAIQSTNSSYQKLDTFATNNSSAVHFIVAPAQDYTVNFIKGFMNATFEDPNITTSLSGSPISVHMKARDSANVQTISLHYDTIPAHNDTLVNDSVIHHALAIDTLRDTVTANIALAPRADFVFHGLITVDVINFPLSTTCPSLNNGYILEQNNDTKLKLRINEFYAYDSTTCPVDSGEIVVYDNVSDISNAQTLKFYNGKLDYTVHPGKPNIASPYLKVLQFFAHVGSSTSANWGKQILVTGHNPHTQTFVTKTPELPFFVLHDPPGDGSYSFLSKDSSVSYAYHNSYQIGGSAGPYVDAKIGAGVPVPFTGIVIGVGTEIQAEVQTGQDQSHGSDVNTTFTASQQFSTSSSSDFVGRSGDVFVGGSFNMIYALTDVISVENCTVKRDTQLAWGADGLATTYIYTEKHISETLLPQLELLKSLSHGDTIQLIQSYIDVWKQVLQKNRKNSDTAATFVQNISFSAGAPYDNSSTNSNDSTYTIDYTTFMDVNAGIGVFFGAKDFSGTNFGAKMNFHWNISKTTATNVQTSKTIGYHLEDSNPGDFVSVDVKSDKYYGTPAFKIAAGTTSCPHEEGTQARDSVNMFLLNSSVSNVPINAPASYVAHIVNLSESNEMRTYNVQAVPESNLDGAIIKIGGQQINNSPASFTVPAGADLPVVLTVERGPIASDYNGLQVRCFSPCDDGEGNTIDFEAHFQSSCSPIGLYTPSDNWLVNASSHDSLQVIFSAYNAADPNLISIGLEYRRPGGTWLPAVAPILKGALGGPYYPIVWNTSLLPEGDYELRAYANCGAQPGGRTLSQTLHGRVDRHALELFGTPTPADGVLNRNQQISVSFNGAVDCIQASTYSPIYATLVRADNGQVIADSVVCNGNQLIIYTNPPSLIDSLENVTLTATINNVYDLNGNSLQDPIVWSFMVNRSKVYWSPSNLNINTITGTSLTKTAIMLNTGPQDSFSILKMPSWLSTPPVAFYNVAPGTPATPSQLPVNFTVSNALNPGHDSDTVIAFASGRKLFLFVNLDVVKPNPHWEVNPSNYQYSMNIVANYSLNAGNTPHSTDVRDSIAVFKGEECRGVAGISYDAITNRYVAFITAYSNSAVGDSFTFRIWDAVPGTEYQAKEILPFVNDGIAGQPLAPYILHTGGVYQTAYFKRGWNWFSLNVKNADMSPTKVLASLKANNGAIVKTQESYAEYNASTGRWIGALSQMNNAKSYMLNLNHDDTLHYVGQFVKDTNVIALSSGWNWIGFPRQDISDAKSFLKNTIPTDGDLLKTQNQFTSYQSGNWAGTLNYLYPGQGYKLRSGNAFNFVIAPDRSLPSWNVNQSQYEQNMSVTSVLQFNGSEATESHYLIGAFVNGTTCVGIAQPEYIQQLNSYRVFLTVAGDTAIAGRELSFKVYDTDNDVEYTPSYDTIHVVADTTVAQIAQPYVLNVRWATGINSLVQPDGYSLLQNIPNPFTSQTAIEYVIPQKAEVTIRIFDEAGRMVKVLVNGTQTEGRHKVTFEDGELQNGVYFYEMKSGAFSKTRRMLLLR
ncbi:MAG: T9SS type A sorting domain-containing protein [Chitinophagales bacterium]